MTMLKVELWGTGGVSFSRPVPLPNGDAVFTWDRLAVEFLLYALAGRPFCFVSDDDRTSSVPYADDLTDIETITVGDYSCLLAFAETATPERLTRLVTSGEFRWDAVWIVPVRKIEVSRIYELVRTLDVRAPERVREEVIMSSGDGCALEWLNPNRPINDIVAELTRLTEAVGWSINTSAVPSDVA